MLDLLVVAIGLVAHPIALVGCIVLGVWARTFLHAIGYAVGWAVVMELFVAVTGRDFADLAHLGTRFGLRAAGAIVLTLGIFLLYRALRGGGGGGTRSRPPGRPTHLRRVK